MKKWFKDYYVLILFWLIFEVCAVLLTVFLKNSFYFFNFTYIGTCLSVGIYLYSKKVKYARCVIQFLVGCYMLIYLGIICKENMQIEGFWYYLFLGSFEAAVIHYLVAKIIGPLFFGRGFCGYACWTSMILDLLPYKTPKENRKNFGFIRYIVFFLSLLLVLLLFIFKVNNLNMLMFYLFILGNVLYYALGIILAYTFKDNRAFCKYVCPASVFLRLFSRFSFLRVKCDHTKCISCKKCIRNCPMNVNMIDNSFKRENGNECILCLKCIDECPKKALHL